MNGKDVESREVQVSFVFKKRGGKREKKKMSSVNF